MNTEAPLPVTKSKRVSYGFSLSFPETFTMRQLRTLKHHKVKYITLHKRVEKALASGEIVVDGTTKALGAGRGRPQKLYRRVDAKTPMLTSEPVVAVVPVTP